MIDTKTVAGRRSLAFASMQEVLRDVRQFGPDGPQFALGNWTPGEIVDHVAIMIDYTLDGFAPDSRPAFPFRILGRLIKKGFISKPMKPGFQLPRNMTSFLPRVDVTWSEAVARLERGIARFEKSESLHDSPFLGRMSRDDWVNLTCRHAELHFSFMK